MRTDISKLPGKTNWRPVLAAVFAICVLSEIVGAQALPGPTDSGFVGFVDNDVAGTHNGCLYQLGSPFTLTIRITRVVGGDGVLDNNGNIAASDVPGLVANGIVSQ